jgi:hypothetical protein
MDTELAAACNLLQAEFPDLPRSTLEAALREVDLDIPAARRKLLDVQSSQQGAGDAFRGRSVSHNQPLPLPARILQLPPSPCRTLCRGLQPICCSDSID